MSFLWLPGFLLIAFVMADLMASTIQGGEGRFTHYIQQGICQLSSGFYQLTGRRSFLVWSGAVVILVTTATWTALLWLGWLLVFMSAPEAVLNGQTLEPAGFWGRVYFAGFAISTLGVGDFQAGGSLWRVLTVLAALNGFFLLTFSITFVVPVAQAQSLRRRVALRIYRAGATTEALLRSQPEGESPLQDLLSDLLPDLIQLEHIHRANPVLHRFHGPPREEAIELGMAALDEALSVLEVADGAKPRGFRAARDAIGGHLDTLAAAWVTPASEPPPAPPFEVLKGDRQASEDFQERLEALQRRRCLLKALVERSGWFWSQTQEGERGY